MVFLRPSSSKSTWRRIFCAVFILCEITVLSTGCRAIRRFGAGGATITGRRLSGQGFAAMHDGQWEVAENLFADALKASRSDDRAHWGMAESFWNRGLRDEAIGHMEQAVRLSAEDPKFVRRLGRMYLETGRVNEARRRAKQALQADRGSAESWALSGDCHQATDQPEDALASYHQALAIQPDHFDAQVQAADLYRNLQRHDRCLATLDRLSDQFSGDTVPADVDLIRGLAMHDLGRDQDAQYWLTRAQRKEPENERIQVALQTLKVAPLPTGPGSRLADDRNDPSKPRQNQSF